MRRNRRSCVVEIAPPPVSILLRLLLLLLSHLAVQVLFWEGRVQSWIQSPPPPTRRRTLLLVPPRLFALHDNNNNDNDNNNHTAKHYHYELGAHKHPPVLSNTDNNPQEQFLLKIHNPTEQSLGKALWDEDHHYQTHSNTNNNNNNNTPLRCTDLDLSVPPCVYNSYDSTNNNDNNNNNNTVDLVWDLLRWEAYQEAQREPLLVSFLYSTLLNHDTLESSLAFLLANRFSTTTMIMTSTQLYTICAKILKQNFHIRKAIRQDMLAVVDRDPACRGLLDVYLYFKGFHALQTHRIAHALWNQPHPKQQHSIAIFLQAQVSRICQIDIHPNATLMSGIMLDHGTGIVIGETAYLGYNCSVLHHVTLGGSGKATTTTTTQSSSPLRHPQVGNGVLMGAGATLLGPIHIGDGCQVGAGSLVVTSVPPHSVVVGVPAKIIGTFVSSQPSREMNQLVVGNNKNSTFVSSKEEDELFWETGGI